MASPHPQQNPYAPPFPPSPIPSFATPTPPPYAPFAPPPSYPTLHAPPPPPPPEQPPFTPFFTLISNPASTTHKHPIVHYVFSDDDVDPVAEASAKDRVVIVDVGADGESVVAAHSLSSEWQVVGVHIASAPQWMAGEDSGAAASGGGLMLTVEGTEKPGAVPAKKAESVYELAEVFAERMALIKRVVEYGEKSSGGAS